MSQTRTIKRLILPAVLLVSWAATPALARSPQEQAGILFKQGNKLRKAGKHERALKKFRAAYRIFPSFKIDLNIALSLYDLKRYPGAAASFDRFLRRGEGKSPPRMVRLARSRLRQLRRKVASVRIECDLVGVLVSVDGRRRGVTPLPADLYLEPGSHRVELAKEGYTPLSLSLDLRPGEHQSQAVELQPQAVPAQRDVVPPPREDPILVQQHRRKSTIGYIFLGTGLAMAAAGGLVIGLGATSGADAHGAYTTESSKPNGNSAVIAGHREDVEGARSLVIAGDVLLGVGLVAVGVSIYQFVTRPSLSEQGAPSVSVAPAPGGAALMVGGQF